MITFSELMDKYYKETGIIQNEEAPTNSTGPAIANPDVPLDIRKKKKDLTYDGRTKIVKELVKRIMLGREKRKQKTGKS